ncbi:MAG: PhnD/SsuA/transferrin family substrate-binding protein [Hyphomicrobiales bacterium]|nr:PhnD/SsuA/transferrin family substrate-binding protein [Hyphomicrobiales bacterium]
MYMPAGKVRRDPRSRAVRTKRTFAFIFAAAVGGLASVGAANGEPPAEVRIGVLAYRGAESADGAWQSTFDYLSAALPQYRFTITTGTAPFLTAAVAAHRLDFVITNPGHFLELKVDYSASALATEEDLEGPPPAEAIGATVFAPAARAELQTLSDLRSLRIAAASPDAFGFRAASREFLDHGIDPLKNMTTDFVGFPVDEIVKAVRAGRADAGIIRSCVLERMVAEGAARDEEFRVIGRKPSSDLRCQVSTRLYPGWPFVKVAQTSPALAQQLSKALFSMQPGADEKAWVEPDDYASVQDLYRTLKVGPYAPFTKLGLLDLIFEHRYWAAVVIMAALWWLVHGVRVSYLVRQRTRELQLAHEAARLRGEQMEHTVRLSLMGEMASSLAHEINQPLAAILTYARGCERRIAGGADADSLREVVGRIAVQAERAGDIVRRMREFVRKNPAPQVPIDPTAALRDAVALFEPTAANAGLEVIADIPDGLPKIRADRLQIEEIVLNLLQNALEAVAAQPDRKVWIVAAAAAGRLDISVRDNGPGLAPGAAARLFDPFFTTKSNGLGLGLSLSRTIVEAHGGQLSVATNAADTGATFRFYLPLMEDVARA